MFSEDRLGNCYITLIWVCPVRNMFCLVMYDKRYYTSKHQSLQALSKKKLVLLIYLLISVLAYYFPQFLFDINCKLLNGAVDKHNLYPPAPPLTRYKETAFPSAKKKLVESVVLDNVVNKKLDALTTSKLCVRMNTLQVSASFFSFDCFLTIN